MERVPMTAEGHQRLEAELRKLKTEERPAVIRLLSEAREHGDLSENAEYHAARERQGFIEARVRELEDKISRAQVIDVTKLSGNTIKFGATVTLAEEESGEETTYQIVGADESDVSQGRLSITAPLARAMIQKSVGDIATVHTPGGSKSYEIVAVAFL
jgi:transcription elongation factor GreA